MKLVKKILLVILVLLSIATGVTKLIQMPEEMTLFANAGFSTVLTLIFGIIQVVGGLLLIPQKTRKYGAIIMIITFTIATLVVFMNKMTAFGIFSVLFIVLALLPLLDKEKISA